MKNALFSWDFVLQLFRATKMVEVTGLAPLAARPRRSKASFAGVRLWQTPHFHRLLLLFPQIFCCAKSLREPCHQPTGLFSLRPTFLFSYNSRANRLLYFGLRPRASRLRDASASGHPLLAAGANASTLKSRHGSE